MSLGECPKRVCPREYIGALGYDKECLSVDMSRVYVFGYKPKGGIYKGDVRGFRVCPRVYDHLYVQGYVYWCISKGDMSKEVCTGF